MGINLDWLVTVGFSYSQVTDISEFFRNIGYAAKWTSEDLVTSVVTPSDGVFKIDSIDSLKGIFKADTQFYKDIETAFIQKTNTSQDKSYLNNIIVYQVTGVDYGAAVDSFVTKNANWAQLIVDSREVADIEKAATKAFANKRLFVGQTSDESIKNKTEDNIAQKLKALNNRNSILLYHEANTDGFAAGAASIMAQSMLGLLDIVYSTVSNILPEDYTPTVNSNLKELNVGFYSWINPINGGGLEQYASQITYSLNMLNGEDIKQRYSEFALDLLLKARSIDFLKLRKDYEDISAKVLDSMLSSVFVEAQRSNIDGKRLIKGNVVNSQGVEKKGFELNVGMPSDLQDTNPILYNSETYPVNGYARLGKTGKSVQINLKVDPNEAELASMDALLGKKAA